MAKIRIRFRLWHLLLVVLLASVGMWVLTQYGVDTAVVVIEKYRVVPSRTKQQAKLQIVFRFRAPADLGDHVHDYVIQEVPASFLPTAMESGRTVQFRFRKSPLRLGFRDTTLWESQSEDPFNKFWLSLFEMPDRPLDAAELKVLNTVIR